MNEEEPFGPDLKARLRAELDRVRPLNSSPRYLASPPRAATLRVAPALLGASVIAILALSAFFATGSPNPAVWGHDVVTIIQSSSTTPTPSSPPTSTPPTTAHPTPTHRTESPEPTEQPEGPSGSGEHHESPEPSDDHSGSGSGGHDGDGLGDGGSHDGGSSDSDDPERS